MIVLSKRLQQVADFVTEGNTIADIGSDHALLPVYLVQAGRSPSAIAADINKGPYEAACRQVRAAGLVERIEVRQGAGLLVLAPDEAQTITIAGMGGSLMVDILEEGRQAGRLAGARELVLQPNVAADMVRQWLLAYGWHLVSESLIAEEGKFYEVLHAQYEPEQAPAPYEMNLPDGIMLSEQDKRRVFLQLGPHLLMSGGKVFAEKWRLELKLKQYVLEQLALSQSDEAAHKRAVYQRELEHLQQVLSASGNEC